MGQYESIVIEAYGWSKEAAIDSLDAKLYFNYRERVKRDINTGNLYIIVGRKARPVRCQLDTELLLRIINIFELSSEIFINLCIH